MKKTALSGEATPEQIAEWKAKHGQVFQYTIEDKTCYLRAVDRNTYSAAAAKISSAGLSKFNEVVIQQIWLAGDEVIRKEDGYYFGLVDFVEELMAKKKGSLTTL